MASVKDFVLVGDFPVSKTTIYTVPTGETLQLSKININNTAATAATGIYVYLATTDDDGGALTEIEVVSNDGLLSEGRTSLTLGGHFLKSGGTIAIVSATADVTYIISGLRKIAT